MSDVGLAAVGDIEVPGDLGRRILAEHDGTVVDYHYCLYHRRY